MAERKYYLDASRAVLMFLGIPMHAAEIYTATSSWLVHSPQSSPFLPFVARFVHGFRLDAFYIIAGYFSLLMLRRSTPATWLRGRVVRLGVPLFACAVLVNAPQEIVLQYAAHPAAGWNDALTRAALRLVAEPRRWILHLWFLGDLIVLSAGAALLYRWRSRSFVAGPCRRVADFVAARPWAAALVGLPVLGLSRVFAEGTSSVLGAHQLVFLGGVVDLHRVASYAPGFAVGLLIAARPQVFTRMLQLRWWSAAAALCTAGVVAFTTYRFGRVGSLVTFALSPAAGVLMAHLLFALTHRYLAHPSQRTVWVAQSSFTVYLIHHPIVVLLGLAFLGVNLPPVVEYAVIVLITAALSLAAHAVVRSSGVLMFLFNGVSERPERTARATVAGQP